jgi:hypothetical protein
VARYFGKVPNGTHLSIWIAERLGYFKVVEFRSDGATASSTLLPKPFTVAAKSRVIPVRRIT